MRNDSRCTGIAVVLDNCTDRSVEAESSDYLLAAVVHNRSVIELPTDFEEN